MFKKSILVLFVSFLMCFTMVNAQDQSGEITGQVTLEDGSSVPGVLVEARGSKLIGVKTSITDVEGKFKMMRIPSGKYTVTFKLEGFKTVEQKNVSVQLGKAVNIKQVMQTGTLTETIEITERPPTIDVRDSGSDVTVNKEEFLKLPKGRDVMSIVRNQAGAAAEDNIGGGIQMAGASSSENTFFVDGMNTTNLEGGDSGQSINFDAVEEVQTQTNGYNAEFGGSMGGVVNVITRSGGNEFHGDLLFYMDGSMLNGEPRDSLRTDPLDMTKGEYFHYDEDTWTTLRPGVQLGGYLFKDKVWFFGSFSPRFYKQERELSPIGYADYANTIWDRTSNTMSGTAKVTFALTPSVRVNIAGSIDSNVSKKSLPPQNNSFNPEATTYNTYHMEYPGFTGSLQADITLSNNMLLEIQGGIFYQDNYAAGGDQPGTRLRHATAPINAATAAELAAAGTDLNVGAGWWNIGWNDIYLDSKDISRRISARADGTTFFNAGGEHQVKVGFGWNQLMMDKSQGINTPYWYFFWGYTTYIDRMANVIPVTYGYARELGPYGTVADCYSDRFNFYLQDSWTIGNRLTLNIGVRVEKEDMPSMDDNHPEAAFTFDFLDKLAPRIGFAYDVNGDGKTKIFGNFGLYYDVMKFDMTAGSFGGLKWEDSWYDIATLNWRAYDGKEGWSFTGSTEPILGGKFLEHANHRIPSFDKVQPADSIKPISEYKVSLGFEQELSDDIRFKAEFSHNAMINTIEDIGVMVPGQGETYYIANPGSDWMNEQYRLSGEAGLMPKNQLCADPVRTYYSLLLELRKQFSNNWLGNISVEFSRLYGNHSGLASSDEYGRQDPGVERYWDMWFSFNDAAGNPVEGLLATDRPIRVKANFAYTFDFGFTIGTMAIVQSGTPQSTALTLNHQQGWYPYGRGDLGRSPLYWRLDAYMEYVFTVGKFNINLNVDIFNVTDNSTSQRVDRMMCDQNITLTDAQVLAGFNPVTEIARLGLLDNPTFNMEYSFMGQIAATIGAKISF